jgi:hypothetical protein
MPGRHPSSCRLIPGVLLQGASSTCAFPLAQQITEMLPGAAAVVYLIEELEGTTRWSPKAIAGEIHLDDSAIPLDSGTLGLLAKDGQPLLLSGTTLVREDYAHLHARRTLLSLAYLPMIVNETLIGALETATFDEALDDAELAGLAEFVEYAGPAFSSATHYEAERNSHLESISRLTQLYPFVQDQERGIWAAPGGNKVAWFKDPDGNVLSVSQHE